MEKVNADATSNHLEQPQQQIPTSSTVIMRFTPQVLPSRSGNLGILLLNNASALNALTLEMVYCMQDVLDEWCFKQKKSDKHDPPRAILLKSNTTDSKIASFCAGGDVKSVYQAGLAAKEAVGQGKAGSIATDFFRHEYILNHTLGTLSTSPFATHHHGRKTAEHQEQQQPIVISFWDGIVMGGGVGISIYGKYRVATERTVWAMPETGIGLFPDVGSFFWMPRLLDGPMAVYLALTGRRLKAQDLLYTGMATHYVPAGKLDELEKALVQATEQEISQDHDPIAPVLMSFHVPPVDPSKAPLALDREAIQRNFGPAWDNPTYRIEDIIASLENDNTEFGTTTKATLDKMSPTSLKLTLEGLRRGAKMPTMADDLRMEYRLSQASMRANDFYEGVRAALIDKDQKPIWNPAKLEQVSDDWIESFFGPIEHEMDFPCRNESKL